jgi:zinc protease
MIMSIFKRIAPLLVLAAAPAAAQVTRPPRPVAPPPKPFVYPAFHVDSLTNGLRFAIVENHELPLVVVQTAFSGAGLLGGSFLDTPGKEGAWGLVLMSLREGTTMRSLAQISDELLDLGTDMRFTSNAAFTPPWFRASRSTWRPSLDLLADVMINPALTDAGVAHAKVPLTTVLDRLPAITSANRIIVARTYGVGSAYDRFATSASLAAVARDDVVAIRQKYLRPQNAMLVVAGDVTVREAREAIEHAFGGWERGGTTYMPVAMETPPPAATTIYLKDVPGANQSIIVGSQLFPGRESPDAAAIDALNSVLGDFAVSSGSRFYYAFRTERGLSYSPRMNFFTRPIGEKSALVTSVAVAPGMTDTAVTTMLKVFRELKQDKPVTDAELDFAKRNLVGSLSGSMEKLDALADNVLGSMRDRLPDGYLNNWVMRVNALTAADVRAAAAKYLDPDHLAITVAGDRSKIEAALRATGIPVVIVDK